MTRHNTDLLLFGTILLVAAVWVCVFYLLITTPESRARIASVPVASVVVDLAHCEAVPKLHYEHYSDLPPPTRANQCVIGPAGEVLIALPMED